MATTTHHHVEMELYSNGASVHVEQLALAHPERDAAWGQIEHEAHRLVSELESHGHRVQRAIEPGEQIRLDWTDHYPRGRRYAIAACEVAH